MASPQGCGRGKEDPAEVLDEGRVQQGEKVIFSKEEWEKVKKDGKYLA